MGRALINFSKIIAPATNMPAGYVSSQWYIFLP